MRKELCDQLQQEFNQLLRDGRCSLAAVKLYLNFDVVALPSREPDELDLPGAIAECERAVGYHQQISRALQSFHEQVLQQLSRPDAATKVPSPPPATKDYLTPPELAKRWGRKPDTVRTLIRSGQLRAINTAKDRCVRPRFLIPIAAITQYEQDHAVRPLVKTTRSKPTCKVDFFADL